MKVYIVECGAYSDRYIGGVFATPELALAANPLPSDSSPYRRPVRSGGWQKDGDDTWSNGFDFDDAKTIEGYEVIES